MAIKLKNNTVFLHVPKTGGSWVTEVLRNNGLVQRSFSHIHADMAKVTVYERGATMFWQSLYERIKSRIPTKVKSTLWSRSARESQTRNYNSESDSKGSQPEYFCFVRHPLDWYESWWRYMNGVVGADWTVATDLVRWHPCRSLRELGDADFNQFVRNVVDQQPGFVTELYGRYVTPSSTFVGRQENLCDDLIRFFSESNVDFDEAEIRAHQRVNVSAQRNNDIVWDPGLRAEVERLEYAGLVRYGYVDMKTATS